MNETKSRDPFKFKPLSAQLSFPFMEGLSRDDQISHLPARFNHFCREYVAHLTPPDDRDCKHDYQLETVGGVFLTGAYVCRLCSYRVGMSHDRFHQHADYPRHYQEGSNAVDTEIAPAERKTTPTKDDVVRDVISSSSPDPSKTMKEYTQ